MMDLKSQIDEDLLYEIARENMRERKLLAVVGADRPRRSDKQNARR